MTLSKDFITTMELAQRKVQKYIRLPADEVSVLFGYEESLDSFVFDAKMKGLWFNSSTEQQVSTDRSNEVIGRKDDYDTRYEFIHPYRGAPWRIEAMYVIESPYMAEPSSPLHYNLINTYGSPCIAHVSWKLPTEDEYNNEVEMLKNRGHTMFGEYRNGYGLFSYWNPLLTEGGNQFFLKPRVNLRD